MRKCWSWDFFAVHRIMAQTFEGGNDVIQIGQLTVGDEITFASNTHLSSEMALQNCHSLKKIAISMYSEGRNPSTGALAKRLLADERRHIGPKIGP